MLWEHKFKLFFPSPQRQVNKIECGLEVIAYSLCLTSGGQLWNRVPYACYDFAIPFFRHSPQILCTDRCFTHLIGRLVCVFTNYIPILVPLTPFLFLFFGRCVANFLKTPFGFHSITTNIFRTISKSINNKYVYRLFAFRFKFNGIFCINDISHLWVITLDLSFVEFTFVYLTFISLISFRFQVLLHVCYQILLPKTD